jgi:hypothetical protein
VLALWLRDREAVAGARWANDSQGKFSSGTRAVLIIIRVRVLIVWLREIEMLITTAPSRHGASTEA